MSYAAIDQTIAQWAGRHDLRLVTSAAGSETRTAYVSSTAGDTFQIWIDPPAADTVALHATCIEGPKEDDPPHDWSTSQAGLDAALEAAVQAVLAWMQPATRHRA